MADVILFYPKTGFDIKKVSVDIPIALLAVSSFIAERHKVKIIDQRVEEDWESKLTEELKKNPVCLGVTAMTCPQITYALQACAMAKKTSPETITVWGGVHATLMPEETLRHPSVDIVMRGEGEISFKNLVNRLCMDRKSDLTPIRGISFKDKNGKIIHTPVEKVLPMDQTVDLPYQLLGNIEDYIGSQGRFKNETARSLIYISSRGCPYRCTFCAMPGLDEVRWRSEPVELTYRRISMLKERFKLDSITFHDENFMVDTKRVNRLAEMINGEFKWWVQARMDSLLRFDINKLVKNGLESLQPGLESGSDRILKMIKKGETIEEYIEANKKLAKTDMEPLYNFMIGFPTESEEEIFMTVDLALRMLEDNNKAMIAGFYVVVPYPGTDLYDLALKYGFVQPDRLEDWAQYNRQHLATPWIQDKLDLIESVKLSSRFVDGVRLPRRVKHSFGKIPAPVEPLKLIGKYYQWRWRRRRFNKNLDKVVNSFVMSLFSLSQRLHRN
ncbi:MAG TPA: B12-binding domain-containing radical SAM protein [Candidatus Brocadiia bacterium]|nr:radical SAM protein [Candidatus Brocadiales bacterium]